MRVGQQSGTVLLSIDLELEPEHHESTVQRRLDDVRKRLVDLTSDCAVPATWAVADPILSAATESILACNCGHEIAVTGDRAWVGPGCGRSRLARELTRRFSAPRKAGISVTTLVLRNVNQVADSDLLIEQGVTAVCGPAIESLSVVRSLGQPQTRFGIWQPPIAWTFSSQRRWWSSTASLVRREIRRVTKQLAVLHLRLSATRLIDAPTSGLASIGSLIRYLAAKRDSGRLAIATVGKLASASLSCRLATPSRSALRPAA